MHNCPWGVRVALYNFSDRDPHVPRDSTETRLAEVLKQNPRLSKIHRQFHSEKERLGLSQGDSPHSPDGHVPRGHGTLPEGAVRPHCGDFAPHEGAAHLVVREGPPPAAAERTGRGGQADELAALGQLQAGRTAGSPQKATATVDVSHADADDAKVSRESRSGERAPEHGTNAGAPELLRRAVKASLLRHTHEHGRGSTLPRARRTGHEEKTARLTGQGTRGDSPQDVSVVTDLCYQVDRPRQTTPGRGDNRHVPKKKDQCRRGA